MNESRRRIFFALWPDDETRQGILRQFRHSGMHKMPGRKMRPENLHITLHFIGNVTAEQFECCRNNATAVAFQPFTLTLDQLGHFPRAGVLWLGSREVPRPLQQLYDDLGNALQACDYRPEARPFKPHVTLVRKVKNVHGELPVIKPLTWRVNRFALVESLPVEGGVRYQPVQWYQETTDSTE